MNCKNIRTKLFYFLNIAESLYYYFSLQYLFKTNEFILFQRVYWTLNIIFSKVR